MESIVWPTAWVTILYGQQHGLTFIWETWSRKINSTSFVVPGPPSTSCIWRLRFKVLFLPIMFSYCPTRGFGTSKPSTFPTRKLFFLLSEEYLEKNQQSPPSPQMLSHWKYGIGWRRQSSWSSMCNLAPASVTSLIAGVDPHNFDLSSFPLSPLHLDSSQSQVSR